MGWRSNVRFGSKADMTPANFDVRFAPESGHHRPFGSAKQWPVQMACGSDPRS
jgi:hypothetical protein